MIRFAKSAGIPTDVGRVRPHRRAAGDHLGGPKIRSSASYPGIHGLFAALDRKKYKLHVRVFLSKYRGYALCPDCCGQRLRR